MAKKLFEKGKSGNPKGRPKTPDALKDCTSNEIRVLIWKLWKKKSYEVAEIALSPEAQAGERLIAAVIHKAIRLGDPARCEHLLSRLIGRVPMELEIEGGLDFNHNLPSLSEAIKILAADFAVLPPKEDLKLEDI